MIDSAAAGRGGELEGWLPVIRYMYYSSGEERRPAHYNTTIRARPAPPSRTTSAMADNATD